MSHQFTRNPNQPLPMAIDGDGCFVIDADGRRYLDGSSGAAVSCLGHSNQRVKDAVAAQLDAVAFPYSGFFNTEAAERLADQLVALAPGALDQVYYVSGGSEAVESAIKLARQYFVERGQPQRTHLIARNQSYHGNTLGALAASGNKARRELYTPLLFSTSHISPCYEYRDRGDSESAGEYGQRVADELETEILRLGPESVMAFLAEPVVGATLGAVPAVDGYFARIREICDRYGVLLILDEVMCGMGRTGYMFACEHDGIAPDIVCLAKGLGAGYQPIGAILCTAEIHRAVAEGSGVFRHGHTYQAHPMAVAAASAVLDEFADRSLVKRCAQMGAVLEEKLQDRLGQHRHVGDIRGRGLFWGVEIVKDPERKEPFLAAAKVADRLRGVAQSNGLLCYPTPGTADGKNGDHVILAPPFIVSEAELELAVDLLARSIDETLQTT